MIAKIVSENREYYSHVFAKFNPGWNECVIVFDNENKKFEFVNIYEVRPCITRKVFIIDTDKTNFIEKDKIRLSLKTKYTNCLGYSWILDNRDLIKFIIDGKTVEEKYIKFAEELNSNIDYSEWKCVKNQKDADDLLAAAWGFHDSDIKSIIYEVKENYQEPSIRVEFANCWNCNILLEFKEDVLIHYNANDAQIFEILESNIIFHDGYIYWVDPYVENVKDVTEKHTYFRGRSLIWKIVTKE